MLKPPASPIALGCNRKSPTASSRQLRDQSPTLWGREIVKMPTSQPGIRMCQFGMVRPIKQWKCQGHLMLFFMSFMSDAFDVMRAMGYYHHSVVPLA
jgi:hypothetical protein